MVPSIIDVWGYDREFCSVTHSFNHAHAPCVSLCCVVYLSIITIANGALGRVVCRP